MYSATTLGHPDPVGGGCVQSVCAGMLAALRAASFVFVLLVDGVLHFVQESDGVHGFCGVGFLKICFRLHRRKALVAQWSEGVVTIFCNCGSFRGLVALGSRCSAFAGVLTFLEGVSEFMRNPLIPMYGGLYFSHPKKRKILGSNYFLEVTARCL